ncbi:MULTISPECIES: DUF995 domain-containing protein [Paraburkholderia]|uniref:DUF995 domain-containing protein n=1 Tax=Paraburkholderia TaxID=1822464 RepID=UPI002253FC81|nr:MULTISPECIES: DUF995 domain-containing protein [Paraburkholderia]MCX4174815.1 DUF995 domain-containing protein [Paraburkholderia madseniana]MDQ6462816.1 DUF995 domain-containing protein [Paraburkholderia madseniana]
MNALGRSTLLVLTLASAVSMADDQTPMTKEALAKAVPGSTMERTNDSGRVRNWTNNEDGSATITRMPRPGGKQGVQKTSGHWSISNDGRYCLTEDWSTKEGGPVDWCRHVVAGPGGALQFVN